MTTTKPATSKQATTKQAEPQDRVQRVPPPPFSAQRARTLWLLLALLLVLVTAGVGGALVPVPTFTQASYVVIDSGPSDGRSELLLLLDPRLEGSVPPDTEVRLQAGEGQPEISGLTGPSLGRLSADDLARAGVPANAGVDGDRAVVRAHTPSGSASLPEAATGEATVHVGQRPLGAVFLGRGFEVTP
jgi:hypothetical protein